MMAAIFIDSILVTEGQDKLTSLSQNYQVSAGKYIREGDNRYRDAELQ